MARWRAAGFQHYFHTIRGAERARGLGVSELWLRTGEAGPFYDRCGWVYVARKERIEDDAVMQRTL